VILRHVTVVDVANGRVIPDQDVVVTGTTIGEVGAAAPTPRPAKATVDGPGKFVMPALVDAGAAGAALAQGRNAQSLLSWGVTAIAIPGLDAAAHLRWRNDLNSGRSYAPRLAVPCAGPRGTAAGSSPSAPTRVHDALQRLVDGGQTPAAALRTFVRDNAAALCLESDGRVAAGRPADLLVLGGNPLHDIRHTRALDAVVFRGELLSQAHLQMLRHGALTPPTPAR
jgi:imidazolonepropionase-like amidohydrolase